LWLVTDEFLILAEKFHKVQDRAFPGSQAKAKLSQPFTTMFTSLPPGGRMIFTISLPWV
jgi:hypothetical protein